MSKFLAFARFMLPYIALAVGSPLLGYAIGAMLVHFWGAA